MRPATGNGLETRFDHKSRTFWIVLPTSPLFLTPDLLRSIQALFADHGLWPAANAKTDSFYGGVTRHVVLTVRSPTIFSLGTPLQLFRDLAGRRDREGLLEYATSVIDTLYPLMAGFDRGIATICLVKGSVLSTGIDLALSCHHLVAERNTSFGLPELLYNSMPGIITVGLLARRIGGPAAERFLRQARVHAATELEDAGIIDMVVGEGAGERALHELLVRQQETRGGGVALNRVRGPHWRASREELYDLARQWADTAAALEENDLRKLERYMRSQTRWRLEQGLGH